jgi:hypothetical protein
MYMAKTSRTRFFRFEKDLNVIPAGVYRLKEVIGTSYWFSIGEKVQFSVDRYYLPFMTELAPETAKSVLTTTGEFVIGYRNLMAKPPPKDRNAPFMATSCAVDAGLMPEVELPPLLGQFKTAVGIH